MSKNSMKDIFQNNNPHLEFRKSVPSLFEDADLESKNIMLQSANNSPLKINFKDDLLKDKYIDDCLQEEEEESNL